MIACKEKEQGIGDKTKKVHFYTHTHNVPFLIGLQVWYPFGDHSKSGLHSYVAFSHQENTPMAKRPLSILYS